jgi:hypothetical protein
MRITHMYNSRYCLLVGLSALLLHGCASITGTTNQQLAVSTNNTDGKALQGAACKVSNDRGTWDVKTPAFVDVRRSAEDLNVVCKYEGQPDGLVKAISRASGGMMGNIILGGGIGAMIDHSKGSGYNYPDQISVEMGKSLVIDRAIQDAKTREAQK